MFPSFNSLVEREQKRQELLEHVQRRVQQASAKREMYADALWASDADKTISLSNTRTTTSSQTDSEGLKKSLNVQSSQINPEASPLEGLQSPTAVRLSDSFSDAKPSTEGEVKPKTELKEEEEARKWIKRLYNKNPNWFALKINPIKANDEDNKYLYLGENGSLRRVDNNRLNKASSVVDWLATEQKLRDILYDGESNSKDEASLMHLEDPHLLAERARKWAAKRLDRKRKGDNDLEDLDIPLKDQRLPDIYLGHKSTATWSDEENSKLKLFWIIYKNETLFQTSGLTKSIVPVMINDNRMKRDSYVWVKGHSVGVYSKATDRILPAITKNVNWVTTLTNFLEMSKSNGLELTFIGTMDKEIVSKPYQEAPDYLETRAGTKTGISEDGNQKLSIPENEAKQIINDYFQELQATNTKIPFRLKPIVASDDGTKTRHNYYFGEPTPD